MLQAPQAAWARHLFLMYISKKSWCIYWKCSKMIINLWKIDVPSLWGWSNFQLFINMSNVVGPVADDRDCKSAITVYLWSTIFGAWDNVCKVLPEPVQSRVRVAIFIPPPVMLVNRTAMANISGLQPQWICNQTNAGDFLVIPKIYLVWTLKLARCTHEKANTSRATILRLVPFCVPVWPIDMCSFVYQWISNVHVVQ